MQINKHGVIPYIIENNEIQMMFTVPEESTKILTSTKALMSIKYQVAINTITEDVSDNVDNIGKEIGLFVGNVSKQNNIGTFLGDTNIHLVEVKDKDMFGDPTRDVVWLTLQEFKDNGRDIHQPIVLAAIRSIVDAHGVSV